MPYRLGWAKVHRLRLYRLALYGSEAGGGGGVGGGGGSNEIIYSSPSIRKKLSDDIEIYVGGIDFCEALFLIYFQMR